MHFDAIGDLDRRIMLADKLYGPFASTHEALGVCSEEWDELRAAIHANDGNAIRHEALDLAAALIRLHDQLVSGSAIEQRSGIAKTK
jgi:hypothetical protein